MEGRRVTATSHDPEAARRFGGSGDYHQAWEQDTDAGTAEVMVLRHVLNEEPTGRSAPPRWQWAWAAYAVWPKGEPGKPAVYEWVAARDAWMVGDQEYPTQRDAVTAALTAARLRHNVLALEPGPEQPLTRVMQSEPRCPASTGLAHSLRLQIR
jgi:hypothetical protein